MISEFLSIKSTKTIGMKKSLFIISCLILIGNIGAQDFHFSQFEMAPLFLNPAKTGLINGNHRVAMKARDQWSSVLGDHAYRTAHLSYDFQICVGSSGHYFGIGIAGLYDQVGTHTLKTFSGNANFSYHHKLSRYGHLSLGLQAGVISYSLGDKDFKFDEQFGLFGFDANAESFENIEQLSTELMPDISPGLMYYNTNSNIQIGVAVFHVNQPAYSFIDANELNSSRVHSRLVFHSSVPFKINRNNEFIFRQITMAQKVVPSILYWQFRPSIHWKYQLGNITNNNLSFGIGGRLNRNFSTQKPIVDALIISSKLNLHPFSIGLSYDVNISPLAQVSLLRSGPELSMIYIFDEKPGCIVCRGF